MSKRQLTNWQQLRKMQREAEPESALCQELEAVRIAMEKPRNQAIAELIRILKSSSQRETQWFIGKVFGTAKDDRVIRPLMQAAQAPENENYSSNFIWPLEKYDCTRYLDFFVKFMLERDDPNEAVLACSYVIEAMNGPFKPAVVKKNIRKLLGKNRPQIEPDMELMAEHIRMSAADALMSKYYLQVDREFHGTNGTKGN